MRSGIDSSSKLLVLLGFATLSACNEDDVLYAGGGGGIPPTNPSPPSTHYLSVGQGAYFGFVTSSPAGIDYGPPTHANPIEPNISAAKFPENSSVQLCASPPPQSGLTYDITWSGSCSGTDQCTTVHMDSDKYCNLGFTPVRPAIPDPKETK